MPTASITSTKTGQTFDVDFTDQPTADDIDEVTSAWETQFYQREGLDPSIAEQGAVGTGMNAFARDIGGTALDAAGGVAKTAAETQRALGPVGEALRFVPGVGGLMSLGQVGDQVAEFTDRVREEGRDVFPTNPANPTAETIGGGAGQAVAMLGTMGAAAPVVGTGAALTVVPSALGGAMGLGSGIDTAQDLGIDNPAGRLAVGAAFGGAEALTERLGGIGGKAAAEALQTGVKAGLKRAGQGVLSETVEEPISGTLQDAATFTAGQFVADPNRPGYTVTGMKLPALDAEFMQRRKMEAIGGAAGGVVFTGLQLAASGRTTEAKNNDKVSIQQEAAVSEDLGELTAEDVADLEPEMQGQADNQAGRLEPILTNVPDRADGVGQTMTDPSPVSVPAFQDNPLATLAPAEGDLMAQVPLQTQRGGEMRMPDEPVLEGQGFESTVPDARVPAADETSGLAGVQPAGVAMQSLREANESLPETVRAKWTPEVYAAAGEYFDTGNEAPLMALTPIQRRRVIQAKLEADPVARAEQEKADKKGEHKMRSQEKEDAAFEQKTTFKNFKVDGSTAGYANGEILAEAQALLMEGVRDFANWSRAMVTRFGQAIRQYLQGIWEQVVAALPNDAVKNTRMGSAAKTARVRPKRAGVLDVMGPSEVRETQSRFASPDEQERLYQVREDVTVKAAAEAWVDSLPMAEAVAAMEAGRLPADMTGDVAQHAAGLLIQRTTEMMKSGSEVVQMQARSLGHRISKVWQGWLSQEAGRNLRQRSVVNSELTPYAPILAAEGMLIDRADAVMDQRFDGGATGGATKVNDTAADAGDEAGESLADDLEGDTPERKAAKQRVRKQMAPAKKKLSKAQRTADRILQQLSERYADPPLMDANGLRKVDPVRALYMQHVKAPMVEAEFVRQMMALDVPQGLAGTLWQASQLEIEARETLRLMADSERAAAKDARQIEVAENQASRLIYRTEERLRQGSKDLSRSTDGDSINKVFRDKVKDDIGWEAFRDRLAKLRVGEEIAARLWRTAERERIDQAAMVRFREERKAGEVRSGILAKGSQKLRQMLNDLRKKIAPDMTWADIFMELPASQKERQREIYRRLMLDERVKGLTKAERLALTNELDKAWQQERRKVFLRELERVGIGEKAAADKAKVVKALPKLIRLINLGVMNSEMFREAIAPEYGLKQITTGQALALRKLAEEAYALPEGVLRSRKLAALLDGIQKSTGTGLPEVLNQYWVAAVLSGMRTQFDTFMSVSNGFGNQLIQSGMLALKNGNRAAATVSMMEWWRGLKQAFPEAMQILAKGDYSYLKRFNEDLKKALEGETTFRPVPLGEALWRDGNAMEKYGFAPVMIFTGRLMAAADHLNNSATTAGAKVVARALHPELYKTVAASQAERDAAAAQARREVTGGAMPATAQERATVAARTREILNGQLRPEELKEANFMGDQAAYQNDPVGVFGAIYRAVNQGLGSLERGLQAYADEKGADGPAGRYARGLMLFLSGALRSMMGAKFIRFGANFGNDMLGYVPGTVLTSRALLGKDATASQRQLLMGKNVFGLMAGLTVAAMFLGKDDEEEGWHLEGPWTDLTPEEVKQRRAAGFEPLTFWKRTPDKVQRVSYKQWPTAGLLAGVAHMQDRQRFRPEKWAKEGMAGHLLAAASVGAFQVKDVSAMRGLADLLGSSKFGTNPEDALVEKLVKMPVNFAGGFIPTLAKDLDALADSRRYKPESVLEEFLRNVPVLRQRVAGGRPEINILGVPIEQDRKPWSRAYTEAENGPAHAVLAGLNSRGFTLSAPETNRKVWKAGAWTTIAVLGADAEWRYQKKVGDGYRAWLGSPEGAALLTNPDGLAVQRVINRQAEVIKMRAVAEVAK